MSDIPEKSSTLIQSITRIVDNIANDGAGYDTLINVLSLLCLVSILNRNQSVTTVQNSTVNQGANMLQKLLGELGKEDGNSGGGADALMSLLPLLNSPQLKSKMNPNNMATIFNLVSSLGGLQGDKGNSSKHEKQGKPEKTETVPISKEAPEIKKEAPAAAITAAQSVQSPEPINSDDTGEEGKKTERYLNWKRNF